MADRKTRLVVGLGNPGQRYRDTRHNLGFLVTDLLVRIAGASFRRDGQARVAQMNVVGDKILVAQPQTLMNLSGGPVQRLSSFYRIPPEDLVVVHDDLDIPWKKIRLKHGGGTGGHNGLKDIVRALGTQDFPRVRLGVGRPSNAEDIAHYVLQSFPPAERRDLPDVIQRGAEAVELMIREGILATQQRFHPE